MSGGVALDEAVVAASSTPVDECWSDVVDAIPNYIDELLRERDESKKC